MRTCDITTSVATGLQEEQHQIQIPEDVQLGNDEDGICIRRAVQELQLPDKQDVDNFMIPFTRYHAMSGIRSDDSSLE